MKMALRQCETNLIRRRIVFSIGNHVNISYRECFSTEKREARPQICVLPETWMFSTISNTKVNSLHETNLIFAISMKTCVEPYMFPCVYVIFFFSQNLNFWLYKKIEKNVFFTFFWELPWVDTPHFSDSKKHSFFMNWFFNGAQVSNLVWPEKVVYTQNLYENGT
jgi:hypothetical protein